MAPANNFFNAARPAFRQQMFAGAQIRNAFRTSQFRSQFRESSKRWQSSTASAEAQASWFKRMWDSPVGIKTVHFWAPVMKWALVLAGVADFARPAEKLSLTQNGALTATGIIWTRWCLIIKPKNYLYVAPYPTVRTLTDIRSLAAVNFFLGVVGVVQCSRILMWQSSQKKSAGELAQEVKEDVKEAVSS
ncbi:putative mitochondrial pyruvate carrier 2 [Colletotrichum liriopes]|uniref:Mitochondrial pyruvate carrier n=1 Tax=Colletotrichum liriopes TaxID=708192 RepID=A0AA37GSW6_9PEZI|nr:putative mitochondrial pyruvate carrier 2 [Colletotrichum liriopes]